MHVCESTESAFGDHRESLSRATRAGRRLLLGNQLLCALEESLRTKTTYPKDLMATASYEARTELPQDLYASRKLSDTGATPESRRSIQAITSGKSTLADGEDPGTFQT